jgi:hypothetical protein
MGSLFSNPGKQAQQGASGAQQNWQQIMNQLEQYVGQQQVAERGAIAGIGSNPYFDTAAKMNPSAYRVNPNQTQTFGTYGPGTYLANVNSISRGNLPLPTPYRPGGPGPGMGGPPGGPGGPPGRWTPPPPGSGGGPHEPPPGYGGHGGQGHTPQ